MCGESFVDPKDVIKCTLCDMYLHSKCANLRNVDTITKMGARRAAWQCDSCKKGGKDDMKTLVAEVRSLTSAVGSIQEEFKDFKKAITVFSDLVDEFKKSMDGFKNAVKDLQAKNSSLEEENKVLKEQVEQLDIRLLRQEQRSRIDSIEVSGVPEDAGERVEDMLYDLAESVGLQPRHGDIQVAHRVKTFSGKHPYPIVCQLASRATAAKWLSEMKKKKNLSAKDIHQRHPETRIYVNEHLVPRLKRLLMETKRRAKECNYKYAWSKEGRIFVRRTDGAQAIEINGQADLKKMTAPKPAAGPDANRNPA